ncbi:MAG: hypothetical protein JO127_15960 [Caulobacteraceae bacterium]|nr:hypothetical protein [Caulobacteraceae bacterium]
MNAPREISPAEAAALVREGAVLVDIRETPELREGIIPGATHAPLSQLASARIDAPGASTMIFHCKAGGRTKLNAAALMAKAAPCETLLLKGGIEAWREAGLPVQALSRGR